jgi:hypothetical protein
MRLAWTNTEDGKWEAQGDNGSYELKQVNAGTRALVIPEGYEVKQLRQPTGQIIKIARVGTLEGSFARAQVWENTDG